MRRTILVAAILASPAAALAQTGGNFDLSWNTISIGGTATSGGSFSLTGTVAQVGASSMMQSSSNAFRLFGGFWPLSTAALLVSIPEPPARESTGRLELSGFRENPVTSGARLVRFSLQAAGPARLDLLDVTGRLIQSTSWVGLSPGWHEVDFGSRSTLDSGVYWLRLTQGSRQVNRKVVLLN